MIEIKILGDVVLVVVFLLTYLYLTIKFKKNLNGISRINSHILVFLRTLTFFIILLLVLNPIISIYLDKKSNIEASVYIDSSKSIDLINQDIKQSISNVIENLRSWSDFKGYSLKTYYFHDKVFVYNNDSKFNYHITDLSNVIRHIENNNSNINIILTDGNYNAGINPLEMDLEKLNNLNILGLGKESLFSDISIEKVDYPLFIANDDSINIDILYNFVNISNSLVNVHLINDKISKILIDSFKLQSDQKVKKKYTLNSEQFDENNKIVISSQLQEIDLDNNVYDFDIEKTSNDKKIILLSGSISNNTKYIKNLINQIDIDIVVEHFYRLNVNVWNKNINLGNQSEIIILDNFPTYIEDDILLSQIKLFAMNNNIPIIFFEGFSKQESYEYMDYISDLFDINHIKKKNVFSKPELCLGLIECEGISVNNNIPVKQNFEWSSKDRKSGVLLEEDAILILKNNLNYGIFIPDLYHTLSSNESLEIIITRILNYNIINNEKLISIYSNKNIYSKFDSVLINVKSEINDINKNKLRLIKTQNNDNFELKLSVDNNKYKTSFLATDTGKCTIEVIYSNEKENIKDSKTINIKPKSFEEQKVYRNDLLLQAIAGKQYFRNEDSLLQYLNTSELAFNNINYKQKMQLDLIQYNKYWLVLLLLLTIEWIIRKRVGLI